MVSVGRSDNADIHVCALVAYDGANYFGSQYQPNAPTVQGALERALRELTGADCRIAASGRTDTGVHALGQVVSVRVPWRHPLTHLQRAWTHYLPEDISVRRLNLVPDNFHPRYSAYSRTYRYTVVTQAKPDGYLAPKFLPLHERFALYLPALLDVERMNRAASNYLVGEHDFASYGTDPHGANTVRQIFRAEWQSVDDGLLPLDPIEQYQVVSFTITATAFLRRMVRNIVGTLIDVGRGKRTPEDVQRILLAKDRGQSSPPAPAKGLVLQQVSYPEYPDLFG